MSGSECHILHLDFTNDPEENELWECLSDTTSSGIKVVRDENKPKRGFTQYTYKHNTESTFTLNTNLGGGHFIPDIQNPVGYVEVYYWNGGGNVPILLGITRSSTNITKYYSHGTRTIDRVSYNNVWSPSGNSGKPLLQLLDEKNCSFHGAIPFEIRNPTDPSGFYYYKDTPYCIKKTRKIESTISPHTLLPGTEYTVQEHTINNGAKISRVTHNGADTTGINLPHDHTVSKARVFSYPDSGGGRDIPLMLQFIKQGNGESMWYYSQSSNGITWVPVGIEDSKDYYKNGDLGEPADTLSNKLDDILCLRDKNITLDLTHNKYSNGEKYCCSSHSTGMEEKVTVTRKEITVGNLRIPYYKHEVERGYSISGIKYNDSKGERKRIPAGLLNLPISGPVSVYAFYCESGNPALIYVDSPGNLPAKKWYRRQGSNDNGQWVMVPGVLPNNGPDNIKSCNDNDFEQLVTVLNKAGCTIYGTCNENPSPSPQLGPAAPGPVGKNGQQSGGRGEKDTKAHGVDAQGPNSNHDNSELQRSTDSGTKVGSGGEKSQTGNPRSGRPSELFDSFISAVERVGGMLINDAAQAVVKNLLTHQFPTVPIPKMEPALPLGGAGEEDDLEEPGNGDSDIPAPVQDGNEAEGGSGAGTTITQGNTPTEAGGSGQVLSPAKSVHPQLTVDSSDLGTTQGGGAHTEDGKGLESAHNGTSLGTLTTSADTTVGQADGEEVQELKAKTLEKVTQPEGPAIGNENTGTKVFPESTTSAEALAPEVTETQTLGAELVTTAATSLWLTFGASSGTVAGAGSLTGLDTDGGEDIPDDLTQLTHLHEASILHSLHCRFRTDKIYSLTGKILIAVNPFKTIHGLYSNEMMLKFMDNTQDKPPHVFSTASDAYQGLTLNEKSQTILISGESGAGKTESTKYVMKYLATAGAESLEKRSTVELKVLESNPLLETFGNASTIRNFNSSRYGKFIELQYVKTAPDRSRICGATIETYLLEKVRVTQQQLGERNYHIFHQLVAAFAESRVYEFPKSERHAHLEKWSFDLSYFEGNFRILPEDSTRDFDLEFFEDTIAAMQTLGMSFDDVNTVFSIIAAILHLSNIQFVVNRDCSEGAVVSNSVEDSATKVTELLNVDSATLLNVLLCRTIKTAHEFYSKPLRVEEASDVRDAIAKNIYSILFDYIVKVANQAIGYNPDAKLTCGILDIFGFECFTLNSFEQLCINFTNETLQNFFNNCVFKFEENLYTQEGVSWNPLDFPDNQDCVDLFKIKVNGLFPMVDEECQLPGGNDQALCNKICQRHANHKRFAKVRTDQTSFIIKHFAGEVKYKIDGFLEKNKDQLSDDAINFIISTKNKPIKAIFESYFGAIGPTKNKKKTISTQFCGQLDVLMSRISGTEPHFIRCIKPNQRCVPHEFERVSVNEQLRCGGMLQVVQVSRAGYPVRMKHLEFYNKFRYLQNGSGTDSQSLSQDDDVATKKAKALLDTLISKFIPYDPFENGSIAFGKSLIFFKNGPYDILFGALQEFRNNSATIIQAHVRCMIQRKLYSEWMFQIRTLQIWLRYKINRIKEMRRLRNEAILLIQSSFRMYVCRKKYMKLVSIVVRISSIFRSVQSQIDTKERHINTMATKLQASWKAYKHRSYYLELRTATIKAQLRWRSILARRQLRSLRMEAKSLGTMIKRVQDLQEELKEEKLKKTDAEAKLLQMGAKVAGLQQSLADMTAKYEKLLKERDSLQIQLSEVENANKRTLEDLKMIKEFVSREAMQTTSSPKRMYSKRPSGSIHRTDTYSSHDMRGEASPKAKVPTVDIILCGPAGCGKSRLVELALISKGDDANLTAHRTFEEKRMEETSLKLNIYEFGVEGSTSLKLAEIPGPHVNTEEARDLFQAAYLVAVCFDPSQEQSLLEGITIAKMLMSHVQLKQTSVAFIQNDFLLMEQGKSAFDANVAQKFAIDNELLYIRVDDLFTFMRKVAPFVESKKSLRSIISSKQSVEFQRQKSLRNANRSTLTMFYEKFRNFWSGVNSSSHSKLLQPTIVVDETTKLPPLSLKKVSHISKYTSAVTCLAIRPEEPTDPYILLAVGRRDGTINVFHCYRTTTELDVLAKGGFEEGAQYPLDESTKIVESFTLSLHTKAVTCMSFSKVNVNELVTSSVDCTIRAWNVMTGELIKVFNDSFPGLCILFHPLEPNLFICCNSSPTIRIVDYNKGTVIQKIRTKSELRCITFDDTRLNCIAGSEKGMLCIYESRANMHLKASTSKQISKGPVTCISFVPATSNDSVPCLIANVCSGNIAVINCIYDGSNGKICELTYRYTVNNSHVALPLRSCYSRFGGGWCVSGSEDRNILFFSLQDENMPYSINFHQSPVVTVEVNQLDTVIVSADAKGIVALWRRVTHAK